MDARDQRAIRAATQAVQVINWIIDHPLEPVPTSLIRPAMESFANYVIDRLLDVTSLALELNHDGLSDDETKAVQPDSIPEMGS